MFIGPEQRDQLRAAGRVGAVGLEMVIAILIGFSGGAWLDARLGTSASPAGPCAYVGLVLGIAAGFKGLFDFARRTDLDKL